MTRLIDVELIFVLGIESGGDRDESLKHRKHFGVCGVCYGHISFIWLQSYLVRTLWDLVSYAETPFSQSLKGE